MANGYILQALANPNQADIAAAFDRGFQRTRKQAVADALGRLAGPAMRGDKSALEQLYAVDPETGMSVQQQQSIMANRQADNDFRQSQAAQSQKNSDRQYQLDLRQFGAARADAAWQRRYQQAQLDLKDPDLVELYDGPTGQPYKARYNPKTGGYDKVGGVKAPSGTSLEVGPDGTVSFTQGMGKMTEGQSKDVGYLNRMSSALPEIDKHENALLSFGEGAAGVLPMGAGNYVKSSDYQLAEQAGNNFLTALLRKESGATVPPAEQKSYGAIFLPQPGDKPAVIAQKREARRQAAIGVKMGLPAHIIKSMVQQGVDFTALDPQAQTGAKSDSQQPRRRRYNPATDLLE